MLARPRDRYHDSVKSSAPAHVLSPININNVRLIMARERNLICRALPALWFLVCRAVREQLLCGGCRGGNLEAHSRHQAPQFGVIDGTIRCHLPVGVLHQPRCCERNFPVEDQQTEAARGLIAYNQAVPSLSDLNLDDLELPMSGDLPSPEAQRGEVLQ